MKNIKHTSLIELKNRLDEIEKEKQDILEEMDRRFPGMGTRIRYEEAEVEVVDELISNFNINAMQFNIKEKEIDKER
jgi:hypothetical protein